VLIGKPCGYCCYPWAYRAKGSISVRISRNRLPLKQLSTYGGNDLRNKMIMRQKFTALHICYRAPLLEGKRSAVISVSVCLSLCLSKDIRR